MPQGDQSQVGAQIDSGKEDFGYFEGGKRMN